VKLVSKAQIADLLGVNPRTVDRMVHKGLLPYVVIGHDRRYPIRLIERMIRDQLDTFTGVDS